MLHFTPKRNDGRPLWRVLYDDIVRRIDSDELKVGEIVKHTDLRGLLMSNEQPRYYGAVNRASKELGKERSRALRPENGAGYCLVGGAAQVKQGQTHKKKGERSIKRARSLVATADRRLMSPDERSWADRVEGGLVTLMTVAAMHGEKLERVQESLAELRSAQVVDRRKQSATLDELAELRRRLDAIEGKS